ncbi:reverse transcriptase family protein [Rhizophagus irregularis DAOM 181602=DAOM 197198]|nr:reverse transcriptase family protein [Rhizophagus irregularis DAOM 181602=DAOM 197198]
MLMDYVPLAKFIYQNKHSQYKFKSYWAPSPSNSRPHDGVGLLLRHPLHKHVQKIDPWKGRLLKLDLFFHQTKISIISVYIPPYHSIHYKERDAILVQLNLWLDKARSNNYHVVILGDFNADEISHSHLPQHHLKILRSLSSRYFTDHQSHISSISGPSPTFYHQNGSSRLDYICSCFAILSKARLKQKSEQRTIFLYKNLKDDTWDKFSNEVNSRLELYLTTHHPSVSSLSAPSLDKLWHALKRSILGGAIDSLPFQHVSNIHHHKYPPELTMLIAVNKFLDRLLFKLTTSRPGRPAQILQMINSLPTQLILLKSLLTDYTIPSYSTTPLPTFVKFLRSQKALVSAYLSTQFHQHRVDSIEYYTALRDEHFSTSLGSFISSALSVEHRSIVLDRVLVVIDSKPTLLTDPSDIKQAAIKHFQSVVTPPLVQYSSTDSFPPRWQQAYTPLPDIDSLCQCLSHSWRYSCRLAIRDLSLYWKQYENVCSTDIPIKMLDAIIHQRRFDKSDDQELWVVSQDISKAFDSIDLNMLRLALIRLHIPSLLIKFIINLFTRRNNKIITHHGDTSGYRVRIGIDQGEIISPLLWVIYLDPLLTTLNREACDPFILKSSALLDYSSIEYEQHNLPVSHITFMDDSTLIASSKQGIEDRLSITAEFYTLNNTQANSAKYILLSSEQFSQTIVFDLFPSSLNTIHTLTLKALALSTSFQFLGVWFNLSASSRFVHSQTVSMVKDMATLLSPKKLLAQHIAYLYNVVLLPRLEFRLQSTLFAESTINRMVSPMLSLIRQKAGLASVTPLSTLFTLLPFSIQQAFGRFLSSHVASWQKIFSHPSYKLFANYMITYLQGFLDCDVCPSTIDLEPWSHTFSLRTHSLFNSLLFSSRLNITWSLLFQPPRKDLRLAIPLWSILPKDLFTSMKNVRKNFCTHFLAQLITPCGSRLLSWKDLRFLKRVSNKGSVPAWFNYLFNLIVIPNSPSFFILQQFRIPSSHTVASISFIDISRNYWFNPQWAISFNCNTNSFLVGRVITTYPAPRNEALISHWIASSVDDLLSEFTACQGCASAIPRSSTSKTLIKRCPSEGCFSYVPLSSLIRYPTKPRTYIHADTRSVSLSASLGYAKSLLLFHLFAPVRLPPTNELVLRISDIQLPSSVSTLYIDDPDGFILESHYNIISSIFPSALRSEVFALLHGLDSLPRNSKITVATDCAQLLSLWSLYNLDVTLIKVPAHADDPLNNHVDALAKAAHTDSHLSSCPPSELMAPCILQFNSLPPFTNF